MGLESPLGQMVRRLLEAHPGGLHKAELLKQLRATNPFANEQHLDEILADRLTFTERPGQVWLPTRALEESQPDEPSAAIDEPPSYERDALDELPWVPLPLDLSTYIVFDFETSGFDPRSESIIQFAAVRVEDGQIVQGCNLFARPTKPLPHPRRVPIWTPMRWLKMAYRSESEIRRFPLPLGRERNRPLA